MQDSVKLQELKNSYWCIIW